MTQFGFFVIAAGPIGGTVHLRTDVAHRGVVFDCDSPALLPSCSSKPEWIVKAGTSRPFDEALSEAPLEAGYNA